MEGAGEFRFRVSVTAELPGDLGKIPFSPQIDFGALLAGAGAAGIFDPNSVRVVDLTTGKIVPHALAGEFACGDRGRVEWVIEEPAHREYEIRFATVERRPVFAPQEKAPLVGVGDLLRYGGGRIRPVVLAHSMKLVDLNGDGRADLAGCWNYYHRPGTPVSGVVVYPRTGDGLEFGEMARLRFVDEAGELHPFPGVYTEVDFADWNGDGRVDLVFAEKGKSQVHFFLNTGERDGGGWPIFARDIEVELPFPFSGGLRGVDLDGDGRFDLVVNGHLWRNGSAGGWPFAPGERVDLGSGERVDFIDLDGDGRLDLVFLAVVEGDPSGFCRGPFWRRREGDMKFGEPQRLEGVGEGEMSLISAVADGKREGVLIQCDVYQRLIFYERVGCEGGEPLFGWGGLLGSKGAVVACSDQAWPCVCDWDGDGRWDLLIGGGYGWPRVLLNRGRDDRPELMEGVRIEGAEGPIRLLRDEILHSRHWHNMGYPYPVFVDWDGDGLPDLMLPNETNRIVWYRNVGSREEPRFGERQFIEVDGFPDSEELRAVSGRLGEDRDLPNHPYPQDENAPFFWRTGAAFADWNGDGLMDFITHNGARQATLFCQYVDGDGTRRVRIDGPVRLAGGRIVDDSIVGREKHWTESFRPVDWDGDGLVDLIYNLAGSGEIYLLRNVGSQEKPVFAPPRQMKCYGEPISFTIHGPNAWPADLNGDGKPDLLGCVEWSVYPFFAHAALEMKAHPEYRVGRVTRVG